MATWKKCKFCLNVQGVSAILCKGCGNDKFWIVKDTKTVEKINR